MADKSNMIMKNYDINSESSNKEENNMNIPFGGFPPIVLCDNNVNLNKNKILTRTINSHATVSVPLSKILALRKNINNLNRLKN